MRRKPILALLTAALAAVFICACGSASDQGEYIEGWYWVPDKTGLMPCRLRRWIWIPEEHDEAGYWRQPGRSELIAHVVTDISSGRDAAGLLTCDVFSKVSEPAAMAMRAPALPYGFASESIYQHEERHWRQGLVHPTQGGSA